MAKALYIAEKPSVAREFAKALKLNMRNHDGYLESDEAIVTWCVGHLVTMSYPESYDRKYKRWSFETLPFLPVEYKYEVIPSAKKQYDIVSALLTREDVGTIYVCTDSGREGEYIYRLVDMQANVTGKEKRRVWIDSQTEEEILRGIREAKELSAYDDLSASAYLRAKEDYLMGINFSRALTLKYGDSIANFLKMKYAVISAGRVMTCVLGMVVRREREIRSFVKTPFYRVLAKVPVSGRSLEAEWKAVEGSAYFQSPFLYKENGFLKRENAQGLIDSLSQEPPVTAVVAGVSRKKENKAAPLLYNLAELQNDCSRFFKISPDETLRIVQELYEKKLVTYPRTDARVLSTAVAREIHKNIGGLKQYAPCGAFASWVLENGSHRSIAKTRYVNDKQITDHYAIIPTGQGLSALNAVNGTARLVFEVIVRRFLAIFYPPAIYQKMSVVLNVGKESFFMNFKVLAEPGFLQIMEYSFSKASKADGEGEEGQEERCDMAFLESLSALKKGSRVPVEELYIKEGETTPPKRYNSGNMILAMENAGQLIEDDELRAQIKGSGIGTSATRAEILKKLVTIKYLALNKKTQIITPTLMGEMIYDVVDNSIKPLLNPELTASWEKGLTGVAEGRITSEEYMEKLNGYVARRTTAVRQLANQGQLQGMFRAAAANYRKAGKQNGADENKESV